MVNDLILEIKQLFNKLFKYELYRFLVVGLITVLIDFISYLILVYYNFDVSLSKGISFSIGALFAYFANRSYTFQSSKKGVLRFISFLALYISTLTANVASNKLILNLLGHFEYSLILAFFIATVISATLNFIGMKYYVFSSRKG